MVSIRPCDGNSSANESITAAEDAWGIMFAYARRWQIEFTWCENKSELAFQSPRLWHWEPREKLLLLASLAYVFLLTLLSPWYEPVRRWLLHRFCHLCFPWHYRFLWAGCRSLNQSMISPNLLAEL
jgi:hypothetical protein